MTLLTEPWRRTSKHSGMCTWSVKSRAPSQWQPQFQSSSDNANRWGQLLKQKQIWIIQIVQYSIFEIIFLFLFQTCRCTKSWYSDVHTPFLQASLFNIPWLFNDKHKISLTWEMQNVRFISCLFFPLFIKGDNFQQISFPHRQKISLRSETHVNQPF